MSQASAASLRIHRGRLFARMGKWAQAERQFQMAAESTGAASAYYFLGHAKFKQRNFVQALEATERAVALDATQPDWLVRLGALYERFGRQVDAASAYSRALELAPENKEWRARQLRVEAKAARSPDKNSRTPYQSEQLDRTTGKHAVGTLSASAQKGIAANVPAVRIGLLAREITASAENPVLHFQLALALLAHGLADEALLSLSRARELDPDDIGLIFYQAWATRKTGNARAATLMEAEGVNRSPDPNLSSIGAGGYFQQQGLWEPAATLFEAELSNGANSSDVDYRAGLAQEREYNWSAAENHYYQALVAEPESAARHARLGIIRERSGDISGAVDSYTAALRLDVTNQSTWRHRLGSCLNIEGRAEEAASVLRGLYPQDTSQSWALFEQDDLPDYERNLQRASLDRALRTHDVALLAARGKAMMEQGLAREAIRAFEAVVRQDAKQEGLHYFHLAMARLVVGDVSEAVEAFLEVHRFRRPIDIGKHSYFEKQWQAEAMEYVEYLDAHALEENLVIFESYHGSKIDCNPAAIYRRLREDPAYADLRFGWVVTKHCRVPHDVAADPRVSLIPRGSALYRRCLGTAHYLVSNVSFPQYFVRRQGQKYLNTWHGTPLKSMGKDINSGFMQHANVARNLLHSTHLLAPNEHTQKSLIGRYEVDGLFHGRVARLGSPRIDRMVQTDEKDRARFFSRLGVVDEGRQVIFYAPTWRGSTGQKHFDRERLIEDLRTLGTLDAHILFRAHHLAERVLGVVSIGNVTVVPADVDTYDVLGVTDVLVTDYSSIFFDFLGAKKPIVFYAYDLEEYVAERGLYFDLADMPGDVAHNVGELENVVNAALRRGIPDPAAHERAREAFAPFEDGHATERAIDFFFADSRQYVVDLPADDSPPILFRHDFEPGPLTSALLTAVSELSVAGRRIVVLFDRSALADDPDRIEQLALLPDSVQRVVRSGPHVVSVEERWNINQFNRSHRFSGKAQEALYRSAYQRDFHRALGEAVFSAVVQVSDLDPVGVALLGSTTHEAARRILISQATTSDVAPAADVAPLNWFNNVAPSIADSRLVEDRNLPD